MPYINPTYQHDLVALRACSINPNYCSVAQLGEYVVFLERSSAYDL
jgi:hypothetical protein